MAMSMEIGHRDVKHCVPVISVQPLNLKIHDQDIYLDKGGMADLLKKHQRPVDSKRSDLA